MSTKLKTVRSNPMHRSLCRAIRSRKRRVPDGVYTADAYARHFRDEMDAGERQKFGFSMHNGSRMRWLERGCMGHLCYRSQQSEIKEFAGSAGGAGRFRGVMTTSRKDRDGDVLMVSGAETEEFARIGSLLYMHVPFQVIGKPIEVEKDERMERIVGTFELAKTQLGEEVAYLIDFGALRTLSIGFTPLEFEPLGAMDDSKEDEYETLDSGFLIRRYRLLECSVVSVPANPGAVITAVETNKCSHPFVKWLADRCRQEVKANGAKFSVKRVPHVRTKYVDGSLAEGSWEWYQQRLRETIAAHLDRNGVVIDENGYASLAITYDRYAVVCLWTGEEERFYRCDWEVIDGTPTWTGAPVEVEVEITTEIRERIDRQRSLKTSKAGRVLSKRNEDKLRNVAETLGDLVDGQELNRTVRTVLRTCISDINDVVGQVASEADTEKSLVSNEVALLTSD